MHVAVVLDLNLLRTGRTAYRIMIKHYESSNRTHVCAYNVHRDTEISLVVVVRFDIVRDLYHRAHNVRVEYYI